MDVVCTTRKLAARNGCQTLFLRGPACMRNVYATKESGESTSLEIAYRQIRIRILESSQVQPCRQPVSLNRAKTETWPHLRSLPSR